MTIRITLRGEPGMRTGTIEIDFHDPSIPYTDPRFRNRVMPLTWHIVTWHRQSGGEVHATTDKAERVTLALDAGTGGIAIGADWWELRDCTWAGLVMTGTATPGESIARMLRVSDAEMARMFPGAGWE